MELTENSCWRAGYPFNWKSADQIFFFSFYDRSVFAYYIKIDPFILLFFIAYED